MTFGRVLRLIVVRCSECVSGHAVSNDAREVHDWRQPEWKGRYCLVVLNLKAMTITNRITEIKFRKKKFPKVSTEKLLKMN